MPVNSDNRSSNSLSYVRPVLVAYARAEGPMAVAAPQAWRSLRRAIADAGVCEFKAGFGLVYGSLSQPAQMYFDACIEVPANDDVVSARMLATQTIAGGVHIASAGVLSHRSLACAFDALLNDPLIGHGLTVADDRPAIITYARTGMSSAAWALTLNMPLCWANGNQGRAA